MKSFAEKQAQIDFRRSQAIASYPGLWARTLTEWRSPGLDDRAWLMYAANYLIRTGDIRWALDPLRLHHCFPEASDIDAARDLRDLSFVLLTHSHDDHLDLGLIHSLRDLPIRWVVPQALLPLVVSETGLSLAKIIVPETMVPLQIDGVTIWPFDGPHWDYSASNGEGAQSSSPRGVQRLAS